jgi:replication initiation protein RepC
MKARAMEIHVPTTPFGRRPVTLGQIAAQLQVKRAVAVAVKPGANAPAAVNKWQLFRTLTEIRERLGVSDRSLSLLNALLTFHPETALSLPKQKVEAADTDSEDGVHASCDLVVFPSNKQLCLRAHGMGEKTVRNHLTALVATGLIIRRDSPNGKRYARKDASGQERFSDAFGFDLTPLVARAAEFEVLAEEIKRERRHFHLLKERISLHRRDIAKLIALALDEALPGPWETYRQGYLGLLKPLRRLRDAGEAAALEADLAALRQDVAKTLESFAEASINTGDDGMNVRHQSNSKTKPTSEFEPASKKEGGDAESPISIDGADAETVETKAYPLGMVMEACPDLRDYGPGARVKTWSDFLEAVRVVRPMIGISPDAWASAREVLGEMPAHVVVATILQRSIHSSEAETMPGAAPGSTVVVVNGSPAIQSAGGYLRALTEKARAGEFALGPVLMALIGQRMKARRAKQGSAI